MGINANDLAISELKELQSSKDSDLFILSQIGEDGKTYTTYRQNRVDIFGSNHSVFQLANPCFRTMYLDYDPNNDPVYDGEKYWVKGGETINIKSDTDNYYDKLERLKSFLTSELTVTQSQTIAISISGKKSIDIDVVKSKSGLLFTTARSTADLLYQKTGISWFYIVDNTTYSSMNTLTLPKTQWNFVGTRGNIGYMVQAGLPQIAMQSNTNVVTGISTKNIFTTRKWAEEGQNAIGCVTPTYSKISLTSSTATADTVQPPATQMDLWFAL